MLKKGGNMKYLLLSLSLSFVSCATAEQQKKTLEKIVTMEADCQTIKNVSASKFTTILGTSVRYINAICDGKRIRCKQSLYTNIHNPFASQNSLSCKERS